MEDNNYFCGYEADYNDSLDYYEDWGCIDNEERMEEKDWGRASVIFSF